MKRFLFDFVLAALVTGAMLFVSTVAVAQQTSSSQVSAAPKPTPRAADEHPDLTGIWVPGGRGVAIARVFPDGSKRLAITSTTGVEDRDKDPDDKQVFEARADAFHARRLAAPNQPPYKPELLAKVKELDYNANFKDPSFRCKPEGLPRVGPPLHIYQAPGRVLFVYTGFLNFYREIPTDGRPHDTSNQDTYYGDSVAHWDGNTLVVDSTNFNDDTWLGGDGFFHSTALHVVERLTRDGDALRYEVTVEDPNVFTRPWVLNPRKLNLSSKDETGLDIIEESAPCIEREQAHIVGHEH